MQSPKNFSHISLNLGALGAFIVLASQQGREIEQEADKGHTSAVLISRLFCCSIPSPSLPSSAQGARIKREKCNKTVSLSEPRPTGPFLLPWPLFSDLFPAILGKDKKRMDTIRRAPKARLLSRVELLKWSNFLPGLTDEKWPTDYLRWGPRKWERKDAPPKGLKTR